MSRVIRRWLPAAAGRAVLLAALWWAAAEGRPLGWYFVVPGLAVALAASLALNTPKQWSPVGFARFTGFFLVFSVWGGADVAWRAIRPGPPLAPGVRTMRLRLADPHSRLVVTRTMTLLPGTLGVRLEERDLTLHLLDVGRPNERILRRCELRVAALHRTRLVDGDAP